MTRRRLLRLAGYLTLSTLPFAVVERRAGVVVMRFRWMGRVLYRIGRWVERWGMGR